MKKDCIKIDDMVFTETHPNPVHGTIKARLQGSSPASKVSLTTPLSETARAALEHLKGHELEVYIVRKGSNMANLGMALIKASFDQGYSSADKYESLADEVRGMIGTRILTKAEPEPQFIHDLEDETVVHLRIDNKIVASCIDLQYYRKAGEGTEAIFERLKTQHGLVHALRDCNTEYFKDGFLSDRCYLSIYTRPACPEQVQKYLILKYEHLKRKEHEANKNK